MNPLARAIMACAQAGGAPLTLPTTNLLAAWDARVGVTEAGTGVSSWVSSPGSYNVAQGTDAKRPSLVTGVINGHPVVRFTRANGDFLSVNPLTNAATNYTFYLVLSAVTPAALECLFDSTTGRLRLNNNPTTIQLDDGTARTIRASALNSTGVLCVVCDGTGTTVTGYLNGTAMLSATLSPKSLGGVFAIGSTFAGTATASMDLAALYIYTAAHDATARAAVHAYTSQEWALP